VNQKCGEGCAACQEWGQWVSSRACLGKLVYIISHYIFIGRVEPNFVTYSDSGTQIEYQI
jgi:hypothetical protein